MPKLFKKGNPVNYARYLITMTLLFAGGMLLAACGGGTSVPTAISPEDSAATAEANQPRPRFSVTFTSVRDVTLSSPDDDYIYEYVPPQGNMPGFHQLRLISEEHGLEGVIRFSETFNSVGNYATDLAPEDIPAGIEDVEELTSFIGGEVYADGERFDIMIYGRVSIERIADGVMDGTFAFEFERESDNGLNDDDDEEATPAVGPVDGELMTQTVYAITGSLRNIPIPGPDADTVVDNGDDADEDDADDDEIDADEDDTDDDEIDADEDEDESDED